MAAQLMTLPMTSSLGFAGIKKMEKRRWNLMCTSSEWLRSIDVCRNNPHFLAVWFYCLIVNLRREWKIERHKSKTPWSKGTVMGHPDTKSIYSPRPKEGTPGLPPGSFPPLPSGQEPQRHTTHWLKFQHLPRTCPLLPLFSHPHPTTQRENKPVLGFPFKGGQSSLSKLSLHF